TRASPCVLHPVPLAPGGRDAAASGRHYNGARRAAAPGRSLGGGPVTALDDLLRCPRCGRALPIDGACGGCGLTAPVVGGLVDLLGATAVPEPAVNAFYER